MHDYRQGWVMRRVKRKYPYPLVEVQWLDAETSHGWETVAETVPLEIPVVTTIGFLIEDNDIGIRIASTIGLDKSHNSRITIPKGMVLNITILYDSITKAV